MSQESITLSMRLRHASVFPEEISLCMGVQPTAVHAVSQPRRSPTGKDFDGTSAETYWAHKLPQRNDAELERADGRWLSRDPIEEQGGINLYAYVEGNPVLYVYPLGLWGLAEHNWVTEQALLGETSFPTAILMPLVS